MRPSGFKCPKCGAWTEVYQTRSPVRFRICENLHRFKTLEQAIDDTEPANPPTDPDITKATR